MLPVPPPLKLIKPFEEELQEAIQETTELPAELCQLIIRYYDDPAEAKFPLIDSTFKMSSI